ncbi:MAG: hypothetical protein LQ347_004071 [Umbilicaria vellea]|nr:MAG: hypothetical protein LQ347_004071 [Umbilicaria vellea]
MKYKFEPVINRISPCGLHLLSSGRPTCFPSRPLRGYATQTTLGGAAGPSRKQITMASDDGRVRWGDLSTREKAARTTQQTLNFGIILAGMVMTGGVAFLLYTDVFSSDSTTSHFNRAVGQVRADSRVRELLGPAKQIRAFGEPSRSKWAMARPIASKISKDRTETQHLVMHFNVEGPLNSGVVNMHMTKAPGQSEYQYKYLALDVKAGHSRIYLENVDAAKEQKKTGMKMFGVARMNAETESAVHFTGALLYRVIYRVMYRVIHGQATICFNTLRFQAQNTLQRVVILAQKTHRRSAGYTEPISCSYKLWARLSRFHRNLKGNYSCTEALLKEAHCLTTNIHVYKSQGTWITEGPSLEYWISDAMDAPIGSEAEIFSGDLPNEIWTMVFKNLLQHDLSSCLRVSCKSLELERRPGMVHDRQSYSTEGGSLRYFV